MRIFSYSYIVFNLNYNYTFICAIEKEAEALAAFVEEEETAKPPVELKAKVEDAPDGKFEDFVAAGMCTAELVAAGARAASHVADAVLGLCRGGGDARESARGLSGVGPGIGSNGTSSISSGISLIVSLAYFS